MIDLFTIGIISAAAGGITVAAIAILDPFEELSHRSWFLTFGCLFGIVGGLLAIFEALSAI